MQINKLIVYGGKLGQPGSAEEIYHLEASNRGDDNRHEIDLSDPDKQLEFVFGEGENSTTWICDAATLHELYPEMDIAVRKPGQRDADADGYELPPTISAPGAERGVFGNIAIKLLKVFLKSEIQEGVGDIARRLEDKNLKHGIPDNSPVWTNGYEKEYLDMGAGMFRIDKNFTYTRFDGKPSNTPFFLFIHGTNSNALGAFNDLRTSAAWPQLFNIYGNNVIAFQHRTLTESPLDNVVKLVNMLPDNATLHIMSHSRGGIVGDILCKYSSNGSGPVGFSDANIELLKKEKGREKDIENIKTLNRLFKAKKISVTKFLRVACPAAGTKLASKRLDHFLNAFFNLFGGAANIFADVLKELLSAAVSSKENVDVLPGLEAQNPSSPFIKVLNDQSEDIAIDGSSLAVISGNGTFSLSGNGLLVILCKLFYWQRNDLVVNTDSMYLGAKRKTNIQYFFDQGADVNHVKYFLNPKTRDAISIALNTPEGALIPGFKAIQQNEVPGTDRDDRGLDHGELFPDNNLPSGKKPIVVILPGIMGSNLERNEKKIWLNYIRAIFGDLTKLEYSEDREIKATSLIKTSYKKLATRLSNSYDVVIYPFDWRKQLNDCAKEFDAKIKSLLQFGQPIKIIGHSMGGVLVRDFIINHDDTWQRLNSSKGFRMLFLGSPLGGSFRIPAVLFGQDSIINSLSTLDQFHTKKELLEMFSNFPGILSLLPITTDEHNDFASAATWKKMREIFGDGSWPLPDDTRLQEFKNYRDNILAKRDAIDYSNMVYIAGKDKQTPCGYFNDNIPPRTELVFLYTAEGDQSVTWEMGIPAQMIKNDTVYYVPVTHGALANAPEIFEGIEEILASGATRLLDKKRPVSRSGEDKIFRSSPETNFDFSEAGLENAIFGIDDKKEPVTSQVPVSVTVSNGDLSYASYPVLAGHFVNDGILYAERVIDENLNGLLSDKHQLGLYPGEIGTNVVFGPNSDKNFAGAIITGLGEPGKLTSTELAKTVAQGVSNYLMSIREQDTGQSKIGISALLIACGYGGLSVESSLKAIIEGVNNANSKAISLFKNKCKTVQHIEFVEIYLDKALSCMYALNKIESRENFSYNIRIGNKKIRSLLGLKKRLPLDTSEDWWNRITVKFREQDASSKEPPSMLFGASTGEAREEEKELYSSTPLIDLFVSEISTKNQWSSCTAKTLFELMIPNEFKEKLKRKGNIAWVLDSGTAAYPWELLQDNTTSNAKPLCINAGMIRQLAVSDYRINIKGVASEKALVVADPPLNGFISQLPGAAAEGAAVEEILNNNGYPNNALIGADAATIVKNLFCEDYTIIHLAGHGVSNPASPKKSGMVIGKDVFLTVFDIEQMTLVPELVFVNCCHLGKVNSDDEKYYQERYKLAANIGTELIRIGVKAVIAAGWAVNDDAALDFARQFYNYMFAGDNFGDAVKKARSYVYDHHKLSNTWGAYQCYGDPFYKLKKAVRSKKVWEPSYIAPEEAEIDLENLLNQLQMGKKTISDNMETLGQICKAVDNNLVRTAQITEKEALIYFEMAMYEEAVEKFKLLLKTENAGFSFSSMEKYCNVRAKHYVSQRFANGKSIAKDDQLQQAALAGINQVITDLNMLLAAGETAERHNILGSTYKRKAMLESSKAAQEEAFRAALYYYNKASQIKENENRIYSVTNSIEMESILVMCGSTEWGGTLKYGNHSIKIRTLAAARKQLEDIQASMAAGQTNDILKYWDMVAFNNVDLCRLLINEKEEADDSKWERLSSQLNTLWKIAGSAGKKLAELEHLQFLVFAIAMARGIRLSADFIKRNIFDGKSSENLSFLIDQIRVVYGAVKGQPVKKQKTATVKKAAAKKAAKKPRKK